MSSLRARDDAEAQLVVDRGRDGVLLREELRVERVLVLSPADELRDGKARREHAADDAVDLLLDQVEDLLVGQGEHEEQLAPVQVMDDVHRLEDVQAQTCRCPWSTRRMQQLLERGLLDRLRDRELEVTPQVADGLALECSMPRAIGRHRRAELLRGDELAGLVRGRRSSAGASR